MIAFLAGASIILFVCFLCLVVGTFITLFSDSASKTWREAIVWEFSYWQRHKISNTITNMFVGFLTIALIFMFVVGAYTIGEHLV